MQAGAEKILRKFTVWQMAVFKSLWHDNRGISGTALLAGVLCVACCLHIAAYWLRQEAEETQRMVLRRQLHSAVQALAKSGFKDAPLPEGGLRLPPYKLYPGGYTLTAGITEQQNGSGITRYNLTAAAGSEKFSLQQLKITLPRSVKEIGQHYTLASGKTLTGAENLPEGIVYAENMGSILTDINVKNFAAFQEMAFPTKTMFEEYGLSGALYYDDGNYSKSIASPSKNIKGQGFLAAKMSIFIADAAKMPDFCVIISDGQIEVGKNAVLGKALLLSKYDITIKSGAAVNGIVLCDGRLIVENGAAVTRDESVLQPFVTAYRLKQQ